MLQQFARRLKRPKRTGSKENNLVISCAQLSGQWGRERRSLQGIAYTVTDLVFYKLHSLTVATTCVPSEGCWQTSFGVDWQLPKSIVPVWFDCIAGWALQEVTAAGWIQRGSYPHLPSSQPTCRQPSSGSCCLDSASFPGSWFAPLICSVVGCPCTARKGCSAGSISSS